MDQHLDEKGKKQSSKNLEAPQSLMRLQVQINAHRSQHTELIPFLYALFEDYAIEREFMQSAISFSDYSEPRLDKIDSDDLVVIVAKALKQMMTKCEVEMKQGKKEQMSYRADQILTREQRSLSGID